MNCKQIHNDLIFYLGNELDEETMEAIGRHLRECEDCRQFAEMIKQQMQLIDSEKRPEISPYFFTRLTTRLDEVPQADIDIQPGWIQAAVFSILLATAITGGIYIGHRAYSPTVKSAENNLLLMNDFEAEPIETFLLSQQ